MGWKDLDRLDRSFRILIIISIAFILLALPWSARRGLIGVFSVSFYTALAFLAVQGALVLWSFGGRYRTWFGKMAKWTVIISFTLALVLTLMHIVMGTTESVAGFEVRSIERLVNVHSVEGGASLLLLLWVYLLALAWFFVAAISGGTWMVVVAQRSFLPSVLMDLRKLSYDGNDPLIRRAIAWLLSIPYVLEPSTLHLDAMRTDVQTIKRRMHRAVIWQMALGTLIGIYVGLNPTLLSVMPYAQTFELVSIPVGLIPLIVLPLLSLEALGARIKGPRADFYLDKGAKNRLLQAMLTLLGLFGLFWWAVDRVGASRIAITFASYALLLFLFSLLTSFIYFHLFEKDLIENVVKELEDHRFQV